jgi:hypothetical protein
LRPAGPQRLLEIVMTTLEDVLNPHRLLGARIRIIEWIWTAPVLLIIALAVCLA